MCCGIICMLALLLSFELHCTCSTEQYDTVNIVKHHTVLDNSATQYITLSAWQKRMVGSAHMEASYFMLQY